jgi:H+-transporting ATPase
MIVLLAILNDIPIMTIAVDNTPTPARPVRWDMKRVLSIASLLGVGGVVSSFILFWFVKNRTGMTLAETQTVIFLKLLVAGHMTIFLTRNMGWMWDRPWPDWRLFAALEGTQLAGTLVAVYGVLITPIGWGPALAVWGFSIVSLLVLNVLKVVFVRLLGLAEDHQDGEEAPEAA